MINRAWPNAHAICDGVIRASSVRVGEGQCSFDGSAVVAESSYSHCLPNVGNLNWCYRRCHGGLGALDMRHFFATVNGSPAQRTAVPLSDRVGMTTQ